MLPSGHGVDHMSTHVIDVMRRREVLWVRDRHASAEVKTSTLCSLGMSVIVEFYRVFMGFTFVTE